MSAVENKSNVKHDSGVRLRLLQIQALQWIERDATEMPWAQHTMPFRAALGIATASLSSQFELALLWH